MAQRATIRLHIDQYLPDGVEEAEEIINGYIDELAKTNGTLTWSACDWELFDVPDGEVENGLAYDGRGV